MRTRDIVVLVLSMVGIVATPPLRVGVIPLAANVDGDDVGLDDIVWWVSALAPDRFRSDVLTNVAFAEFNRWDLRTCEVDGSDASQFRSRSNRFRSR